MKPDLETLLNELYSVDPTLKQHEKILQKVLQDFVAARPNVKIDETFRTELKKAVWKRIDEVSEKAPRFKWSYAVGGVVVASLLLVPILYTTFPMKATQEMNIQSVEDKAFGELNGLTAPGESGADGLADRSEGSALAIAEDESADEIAEDVMAISSIAPWNYRYVYTGDPIELTDTSVEVLKRTHSESVASEFGNAISAIGFDLMDLSAFGDLNAAYITLTPESGTSYGVNLDFNNNSISINYWDPDRWEREYVILTEADQLSDSKVISIADKFLNQYDIATNLYGDPEVVEEETYGNWIPEYVTVIYPLLLNGETVYEEYGGKSGLSVSVSIQYERVESVWGIMEQNYDSATYDAVTDVETILEVAEKGGVHGYLYEYDDVPEITIGTPTKGYTKMYQYGAIAAQELYVPALIFPILEEVEYSYKQFIVVPLASDLLEEETVEPMPFRIMEAEVEE